MPFIHFEMYNTHATNTHKHHTKIALVLELFTSFAFSEIGATKSTHTHTNQDTLNDHTLLWIILWYYMKLFTLCT